MRLLWTRSSYPVSPIILWLTDSESSHFCVEFFGTFIFQANFKGIGFLRVNEFLKHNTIVFEKKVPLNMEEQASLFSSILIKYWGAKYDFKWFFNVGVKALLYKICNTEIPSDIKWQSRAKFICSETAKFLEPIIGPVDIGNGLPDMLWKELKDRNF